MCVAGADGVAQRQTHPSLKGASIDHLLRVEVGVWGTIRNLLSSPFGLPQVWAATHLIRMSDKAMHRSKRFSRPLKVSMTMGRESGARANIAEPVSSLEGHCINHNMSVQDPVGTLISERPPDRSVHLRPPMLTLTGSSLSPTHGRRLPLLRIFSISNTCRGPYRWNHRLRFSLASSMTAAFPKVVGGRLPHWCFEACSTFTRVSTRIDHLPLKGPFLGVLQLFRSPSVSGCSESLPARICTWNGRAGGGAGKYPWQSRGLMV